MDPFVSDDQIQKNFFVDTKKLFCIFVFSKGP